MTFFLVRPILTGVLSTVILISGCRFRHNDLPRKLNLGFELATDELKPINWYAGGGGKGTNSLHDYKASLDTVVVHGGRHSLHFEYAGGVGNGVGICQVPIVNYVRGKLITYSGWIKTREINRMVGLWWRVDGPDGVLAMNTMHDSAINGTRDWSKYSYSISVDSTAKNVNFGVMVQGPGEAWFDDLQIDTNGVPFASP